MSETPFPVSAPPPDAASLAALLQSAAQALLRSGTPSDEEHPAPAKVERIQEEIRHYRFPPLAVRCEKELLEAENAEEMRVQLRFPGKPDEQTRSLLKSHGFRWSPTQGAWQRQLNGNGTYAARQVMNTLANKK